MYDYLSYQQDYPQFDNKPVAVTILIFISLLKG